MAFIYFFNFNLLKMNLVFVAVLMIVVVACGEDADGVVVQPVDKDDSGLDNTDLMLAFVVFRHGDRTPDDEELDLLQTVDSNPDVFFPFGMKALTNEGKQRGFKVGQYLRNRYDGFISKLYLQDDIIVRTTDYARTKMTALTALAALYPPLPAQKWNPNLNWQPVPYNTEPSDEDDLLYYYNCPRYITLRNQVYETPQMKEILEPYNSLYKYLTAMTGTNITTPEDVFYLDNLFQTLHNVDIRTPKWAQDVMTEIKEMTKIEYAAEFYTPELIKLSTGVLISEILDSMHYAIEGLTQQPKLRLYSAHENNVAAIMAAARVFQPHQPRYGATFSLELRRRSLTGQYGVTAVYSPDAGGPGEILTIEGCDDLPLCPYEKFVNLTQLYAWSFTEYRLNC